MENIKHNITFINDNDLGEETYLWRYIDIHKFLSFIFDHTLYLTRLDKFEDKLEGISLLHLLLLEFKKQSDNDPRFDSMREYVTIDTFASIKNKVEEELEEIQRSHFANCWVISNSKSESVAMWNLYSNPNSLAIKIKYSDFKKKLLEKSLDKHGSTKEIILGPVRYLDFQDFENIDKLKDELKNSVFLKDISFSHEKEFRIILKQKIHPIPPKNYKANVSKTHIDKLHDSIYDKSGISLKLNDFESYKFEVIYHPKSTEWTKNNIKQILRKFNIDFPVKDSLLQLK